jgi:hypothetical protein
MNARAIFVAAAIVTTQCWAVTGIAKTSQDVEKLVKTSKCVAGSFKFIGGDHTSTTLDLNNDGNWCWKTVYYKGGTRIYMSAYYVSVTAGNPPKHGRVLIGDAPDSKVRVAYQPAPGFVGTDSFTIHFGVADSDVTFAVTVSQ